MDLKNFKMTRKLNFYLLTIILFLILTSCSKDNGTESLIEDKLETMSGKEMLRELLIKNDNDVNQLARIFECSPSSLKRILRGETLATTDGGNQFKNVLNQTLIIKKKALDELDPLNQSWNYKTKFFIENNYVWLIAMLCIIFFLVSTELVETDLFSGLAITFAIIIVLSIVIYVFVNLFIWFKDEPVIIDNFKNTFDPIWEQLK